MNKNNKILERNMKTYTAFNLQAAIDGDPIMDKNGVYLKFGGYFPFAAVDYRVVIFNMYGNPIWHRENGEHSGCPGSGFDLVMAPKKRKVWLRLWSDGATLQTTHTFLDNPHPIPGYKIIAESVHEID